MPLYYVMHHSCHLADQAAAAIDEPTATEASIKQASASAAEQQVGEQLTAADSGLSAGSAGSLEPVQQPDPAMGGNTEATESRDAEKAQAGAVSAETSGEETSAGEDAVSAAGVQTPQEGGAATSELPDLAASAADTDRPAAAARIAAQEAAAAVQAAAEGFSNPTGMAASDEVAATDVADTVVQPAATGGSPGGVSDEDLAAEAAEARRRRNTQEVSSTEAG